MGRITLAHCSRQVKRDIVDRQVKIKIRSTLMHLLHLVVPFPSFKVTFCKNSSFRAPSASSVGRQMIAESDVVNTSFVAVAACFAVARNCLLQS